MNKENQKTGLMKIHKVLPTEDLGYLVASLLLQMIVGILFGHAYDIRISMATGYLVATGQNPYIAQNLTQVFNNPAFQGMTSIGYPPPWPLVLGIIYLISYTTTHNLLLYNLAIKLPIIAANLFLAYLVKDLLRNQGLDQKNARKAWLFLLFNPFLLYFTTAWGQFDSLVAVLTLLSLILISRKLTALPAIALALAIAFKPTPVPIALAAVIYLLGGRWQRVFRFIALFILSSAVFSVLPFFIFHWDFSPILHGWNAQFSVSGGMSITTIYELIKGAYVLPGYWWLLGFIWLPAVLICALFLPRGEIGLVGLIKNCLILILIFFLTRTWLSEQNLTLILPLVLILVSLGELPDLCLKVTWILPLIFTVFNTSPAQLLFPILPNLMTRLLQWSDTFRTARLLARMLLVIPWQVAGWWMIFFQPRKQGAVTA
jgi:Gpi18-like mannosyltransferase